MPTHFAVLRIHADTVADARMEAIDKAHDTFGPVSHVHVRHIETVGKGEE